jgi:hypothetical protein
MLRLFARRQLASMSAYFTNSLTPPSGLGLLASPRGGFSFGRAARGSVAPRKMACRPPAGRNNSGSRLSTRAQGRGSLVAAPLIEMPTWLADIPLAIFALLIFTMIARGFRYETRFDRLLIVLGAIIGVAIALFISLLHFHLY